MGGELLDVVVLAGAHMTAHRKMERRETFRVRAAHRLHLGKAVEHPEIDVMGVGLRDLANPLVEVDDLLLHVKLLQGHRRPQTARMLEAHFFRH
ncbi:MAG: hypothetical protein LC739_04050 [Actinobacteria bacterium]|nr:hypothetical protein [Actinomycetota bacterium]